MKFSMYLNRRVFVMKCKSYNLFCTDLSYKGVEDDSCVNLVADQYNDFGGVCCPVKKHIFVGLLKV